MKTYTVDVTSSRLVLRISVAAISDTGERACDVVVERSVLCEVHLVTVRMAVRPGSMANFGTASDDERAGTCPLQGDGVVHRTG